MDPNKIVHVNGLIEECRALGLRDGAHNAFLVELSTTAKKTLADVDRETEAFRRRGTMTPQIAQQMALAEAGAIEALEQFTATIRALSPRERSVYGMPQRQPFVAPQQPELDIAGVLAEVKAVGGMLALAPDGFGVQLVGCGMDQLSDGARWQLHHHRESFIQYLRRQSSVA